MRRFNRIITAVFLLAFSIVSAHALDAKVVSVTGKVEVQTNGSAWKTLKAGDKLAKGSVISTGFKSSAKISIDSTTVDLGPLTRITIEKLASNNVKDETSLYLDSGKVKADVKKNGAKKVDFKVSSPVATASVRGTIIVYHAGGLMITEEGTGAKGPGRDHAEIDTTDQPTGYLPGDGDANALTPTADINGQRGEIAVTEGQSSKTDPLTGLGTTPQFENFEMSHGFGTDTGSIISRETGVTNKPEVESYDLTVAEKKAGSIVVIPKWNRQN
ncbi:MAG: FecR domain-containing protein [Treponema sp.]|nr:FecR domain-containing protein [Treponema sp.]